MQIFKILFLFGAFLFGVFLGMTYQLPPMVAVKFGPPSASPQIFLARASYYGKRFQGECMTNGLFFNKEAATVAHRDLPLGTRLRIFRSGASVDVTITDRGPFILGRDLDLSEGVARKLGMVREGVAEVTYQILSIPTRNETYHHQNPECLKERSGHAHMKSGSQKTRAFLLEWWTGRSPMG